VLDTESRVEGRLHVNVLPCRPHSVLMKQFYVYILASERNGTLYVGVTSSLLQRTYQHRTKTYEGFSSRYRIGRLVYFEQTNDAHAALTREKQIKGWKRQWKIELIEKKNPDWCDLYSNVHG
jgi:putative endonuclease